MKRLGPTTWLTPGRSFDRNLRDPPINRDRGGTKSKAKEVLMRRKGESEDYEDDDQQGKARAEPSITCFYDIGWCSYTRRPRAHGRRPQPWPYFRISFEIDTWVIKSIISMRTATLSPPEPGEGSCGSAVDAHAPCSPRPWVMQFSLIEVLLKFP